MEKSTPIPPDAGGTVSAESARRGHETSDAALKPIVVFAVVMFATAAVIHFAVWGLMRHDTKKNARIDPEASPFAGQQPPPPEPRLQPSISHPSQPHEDLAELRGKWQAELTSYGPVPGQADRARIPIERAMQLMAERGLPTSRPTTGPATREGGAP